MRFLWFALLLAPTLVHAQGADRYHVRVPDGATEAHVTVRLTVRSDTLALYNVAPVDGLPNGQADLVAGLTVRDASGASVGVRDLGEGTYALARGGAVEVAYTVRLEHDRHAWPFGMEEVGYRTPEGVLLAGYSLFLADAVAGGAGPYDVTFALPDGWHARTPWTDDDASSFHVPTRRELLSNVVFLGTAHAETIEMDGFALTLVLGAPYVGDRALFADLLRAQLASYLSLFGGPPRAHRFLVVVHAGATNEGGSFAGSFSQLIAGDATEASRVVWGHGMAHEFLHFWNGLSLVPVDAREEWFKEGGTDYLTVVTMARNGLLGREMLYRRLENSLRRVVLARAMQGRTATIRAAGEAKSTNQFLIYGGGMLAALALDAELRVRSGDRVGLPDLMRALYAEHGATGQPYTLDDLARVAVDLAGADVRDVLARTVESEGMIDAGDAFRALGLRIDTFYDEVYVSADPAATPAARARFEAVFGLPAE